MRKLRLAGKLICFLLLVATLSGCAALSTRKAFYEPIVGDIPSPLDLPKGCFFSTRCEKAIAGVCDQKPVPNFTTEDGRRVRCVLYDPALQPQTAAAI